jgi:DNA-binding NarL/FixJ family response regulator
LSKTTSKVIMAQEYVFVLLDDHALVRDGIERQLMADFPTCTILYSGDSLSASLAAVSSAPRCDCAVIDLDLGDETPVAETVSAFAVRDIPVVVVSALARPDVLQAALAAGARAFIAKRSNLGQLSKAVSAVLDGDTWIPPDLAGAVLRAQSNVDLSAQEKRALVLYASGLTLEMVARRMDITPNTVKHYLDRVRDKYTGAGISARTKVQLNQVARMEGLLP